MQIALLSLFVVCNVLSTTLAPIKRPKNKNLAIPNQYIVTLKSSNDSNGGSMRAMMNHRKWLETTILMVEAMSGGIVHTWNMMGIVGYSGTFSKSAIMAIRKRPDVELIEQDQLMYIMDDQHLLFDNRNTLMSLSSPHFGSLIPKNIRSILDDMIKNTKKGRGNGELFREKAPIKLQTNAPWGLSRVSSKERPTLLGNYTYPESAGKGVNVYVIDTGINIEHEEFEGRAKWGITTPFMDESIDGNGHGTHCAGIIAGKTYGIAKQANVFAVKVLRTNGFGTNSDVIKGIEWVIRKHLIGKKSGAISVANMSLGGGRSLALEKAVNRAVKAGIHFSVAAGNDNEDACNYSPAAAEGPITVGASTNLDEVAFFSNHGKCVDLFAPGMDILSSWIGSERAKFIASGTSMASPHVAGVMALHLAEKNYSPAELKKLMIQQASNEVLLETPPDTVNLLLSIEPLLVQAE